MTAFRYHAVQANGLPTEGVVEANDRRAALQALGRRGLFPSKLELCDTGENGSRVAIRPEAQRPAASAPAAAPVRPAGSSGGRISRKEITEFTRGLSALLGAAI